MKVSQRAFLYLATSSFALASGAAQAQVDQIVVTAQKKEENLQDVPIAISALTSEGLEDAGVYNHDTLSQVIPGLQIGRQIGAITPYLRGVGTQQTGPGDESSIATYVDGVNQISLYSSIQSYNNIERIEVLKGPQGTLFGRNATGGLINIILKEPSQEPSATLSAYYGNYERFGGGFYGTTGIGENAAIDLSVTYAGQNEGFGVNRFTGSDVNLTDEGAVRSKFVWEPGDSTKLTLSGDYSKLKSDVTIARQPAPGALAADGQIIFGGCVGMLGGDPTMPTPMQFGTCAPIAAAGATAFTGDFYDINSNVDPFYEVEVFGGYLKFEQSLGGVDFISISSYRDAEALQVFPQEGTPLPIVNAALRTKVNDFQQEIRLESSYDSPLQWVIGGYFLTSTSEYDDLNLAGFGIAGLFPGAIAYRAFPVQDTTSFAGFAQAYFQMTDRLQLTAGVRVTHDKREFFSTNEVVFGTPGVDPIPATEAEFAAQTWVQVPVGLDAMGMPVLTNDTEESWTEPTWRVALDYQATDDLLLYASYSRGFKSGVYNTPNSGAPGPVDPEILDAFEIGFKSGLFDNVIRINGAGYFYEYENLQLNSVIVGNTFLLNAAAAEVWGAELDFLAAPAQGLDLRFGLAYVDSEYTDFLNAPFFTPTGFGGSFAFSGDAAGNRLNRAPVWTLSGGASYTVESYYGEMSFFGNVYYNDGFFWDPQNVSRQSPYTLINGGFSWGLTDNVTIGFQAENILDEEYSYFTDNSELGEIITAAQPRTYRGTIEFRF